MKSRAVLVAFLLLVVVLLAWNFLFFAPAGEEVTKAEDTKIAAIAQQDSLQNTLDRLEDLKSRQPELMDEKNRLSGRVPALPDLEVFIRAANDLSVESGLDWLQISPAEPVPAANGISEIRMSMQLEGGYYQVLDYLNRMEDMSRLVVVDTISVAVGGGAEGGGTTEMVPSISGAPTLSVNLTARMFTQATGLSTPASTVPPSTSVPPSTTGASN